MQQIRRAALAPAQPSAADRQVAAQSSRIEQQARAELNLKRSEKVKQPTTNHTREPYDASDKVDSNDSAQSGRLIDLTV
jgi:hypothetical protein